MKQRVVVAKPPVYDACVEKFGADVIVGKPIIWSWGDVIYNPTDIHISHELFAHEAVHGERQLDQVEKWWELYLKDPQFRYDEEMHAHRAEWRAVLRRSAGKNVGAVLEAIAGRLASPLYGKVISLDGARYAILAKA
jgi:hypothetical protein